MPTRLLTIFLLSIFHLSGATGRLCIRDLLVIHDRQWPVVSSLTAHMHMRCLVSTLQGSIIPVLSRGYCAILETSVSDAQQLTAPADGATERVEAENSGEHKLLLDVILLLVIIAGLVVLLLLRERRFVKERARSSEHRYRKLIENSSDVKCIVTGGRKLSYISPSCQTVLGYTPEELTGTDPVELVHPDERELISTKSALFPNLQPEETTSLVLRMKHKNGQWLWMEGTVTYMADDPAVNGLVGNFHNISSRVETEERLKNANRLYAFISQVNQTIIHVKSKDQLFARLCKVAVEHGKFKVAWIGSINSTIDVISLIAQAGLSDEDAVFFSDYRFDPDGPIAQAVVKRENILWNDMQDIPGDAQWNRKSRERGWGSCMILPIYESGNLIATLNVVSGEKNYFDSTEDTLLREAANDISFALEVFVKEKRQQDAERNLEYNQLRLKQAQSIAHFGHWELNFGTGIAYWSEEALRIYWLPENAFEQTHATWMSFIHKDDVDYVNQMTEELNRTRTEVSFTHRIVRADGAIRHLRSQAAFEFDNNGVPTGLYGVAHDITEVKEAELALLQSKANLRLIVDLIPQSIYAVSRTGRIVFANKAFANLCGFSVEDLVGYRMAERIPDGNDIGRLLSDIREVIETGDIKITPEMPFRDSGGADHTLYCTMVSYTPGGTNGKSALGVAIDITDLKEAEGERIKIVNDLVQRNKDLEQFSYIVSHSLRAHLANILGISMVAEFSMDNKEELTVLMQGLATSAKKLDNVVRDLSNTLQIHHNISEPKEDVELASVIAEVKESIGYLLGKVDAEVIADFTTFGTIHTIRSYLYSIFFNLISNSIKYRNPNDNPVIRITSVPVHNGCRITFSDNGSGFDMNKYGSQVFGLYRRFHSHTEGRGLGLFMVKTQVEALGGTISVASEPGVGTTFTLTLTNTN